MYYTRWRAYVPVWKRRLKAEREMAKLRKKGRPVSPVVVTGRKIAATFWGQAWCDNLERYSDYANRLPRGRTYVRNGSVMDLQIAEGTVDALVSGSSIYRVAVNVAAVPRARWRSICKDCAGGIDSLVELLQGRLSRGVMERICREKGGLFPSPSEIELSCSCPDWAILCKHVAAVLYGVGARLDAQPDLLFKLRAVDENDLIAKVGSAVPLAKRGPKTARVLREADLSEVFGLEIAAGAAAEPTRKRSAPAKNAKPARPRSSRRTTSAERRAASSARAAARAETPVRRSAPGKR